MKVVSLFSGCGGLDLGLHQAGHEIILQCESDPGAQQVLKKAFPGTLLVPDVCALTSLPPETELVAAGFPCIDISRAGLRAGLDGESSGLLRHVFRLLASARDAGRAVPWVLLENVEALLDRAHGQPPAILRIVDSLEALGYRSWAHRVVCSAGFGVPNRRKRVFVVASMHGDARDVLLAQGAQRCIAGSCCQAGSDCYECYSPEDRVVASEDSLLHTSYCLVFGNAQTSAGVDVVPTFTTCNSRMCLLLASGTYGMLRITDAERLQGLPEGHTEACFPVKGPGLHQRSRPLSDKDAATRDGKRFELLGNAVTVQVARWIGERLARPYEFKYILSPDRDCPISGRYQSQGLDESRLGEIREELDDLRQGYTGGRALLLRAPPPSGAPPRGSLLPGVDDPSEDGGQLHEPADGEEDASAAAVAATDAVAPAVRTDARRASTGSGTGSVAANEAGGGEAAPTREVTVASRAPLQGPSWPRAAWFLEGKGRYSARDVSETPLKTPFAPLGDFVKQVGPPPPDMPLHVYCMRLKEQGWNIDRTVRKAQQCGMLLNRQATDVLRLPGHAEEGARIGDVVWCHDADTAVWWPCEAVDPFQLPAGFHLTAEHLLALEQSERRRYVPAALLAQRAATGGGGGGVTAASDPPPPREAPSPGADSQKGSNSGDDGGGSGGCCPDPPPSADPPAPVSAPPRAAAADAEGSAQPPLPPDPHAGARRAKQLAQVGLLAVTQPGRAAAQDRREVAAARAREAERAAAAARSSGEAPPEGRRKVLVLWLGSDDHEWRWADELLPYEEHMEEKEAAGQLLEAAGHVAKARLFAKAVQEAQECLAVKAGSGGGARNGAAAAAGAGGADPDQYREAMAARAARHATRANAMPRCQRCEACTSSVGSVRRRCLAVRAAAAAAAGHAGAQLSVLEDKSVGARVSVWWPLDQRWYYGTITDFDGMRMRHTVEYDDGDVEIVPLWAPNQLVRVLSSTGEWRVEAERLAAQKARQREERLAAARAARVTVDAPGAEPSPFTAAPLSAAADAGGGGGGGGGRPPADGEGRSREGVDPTALLFAPVHSGPPPPAAPHTPASRARGSGGGGGGGGGSGGGGRAGVSKKRKGGSSRAGGGSRGSKDRKRNRQGGGQAAKARLPTRGGLLGDSTCWTEAAEGIAVALPLVQPGV